jgi:hypothetical protein
MRVELLYLDGCPGFDDLVPRLRTLVRSRCEIELVPVDTAEAAQRLRFLGSPTVRVNGRDVEEAAATRTDFGMKCRLYPGVDGSTHAPPDHWIVEALGAL